MKNKTAQELANKYNCPVATQTILDKEPLYIKTGKNMELSNYVYAQYAKAYAVTGVETSGTVFTGNITDAKGEIIEEGVRFIRLEDNFFARLYEDATITNPTGTKEPRISDEEAEKRKKCKTICAIVIIAIIATVIVIRCHKHSK